MPTAHEVSFERFLEERQQLKNVSNETLLWYQRTFKKLGNSNPDGDDLKQFVLDMRRAGQSPAGVNSHIRAVNAYLKWAGSPHRLEKLKEPDLILPTFSSKDVKRLIEWQPRGFFERRLHLVVLILLDTGCRISECLNLKLSDCDFENLLVTLNGKGRKQRKVPISFLLRKVMYRYAKEFSHSDGLVVATRQQTKLDRDIVRRDVKLLCKRLGVAPPRRTLHAFRHTFAVNYLRKGGSVMHLQKVLGHTTLEMTRRYVNLLTEDLSAVHQKITLLAP